MTQLCQLMLETSRCGDGICVEVYGPGCEYRSQKHRMPTCAGATPYGQRMLKKMSHAATLCHPRFLSEVSLPK